MIKQKGMETADVIVTTVNVILDTNFFVDMFRFKISFDDIEDVVGQKCKFWMVGQSVKELKRIRKKEAKIALVIMENIVSGRTKDRRFGVIKTNKRFASADDAIISLIKQRSFIVATNDAKLRKKIKALGTRVIYLRARKHLEIH